MPSLKPTRKMICVAMLNPRGVFGGFKDFGSPGLHLIFCTDQTVGIFGARRC
jgi:hypothetical protein